jgi:4-hydroxy-tetrahydrodipicolinate synthase
MKNQIFIPLITPLKHDRSICKDSVKALIASTHEVAGGYIPCLTSGEGWLLSDTQWTNMLSDCLTYAHGRKVIVGIEKARSKDVIDLAKQAESLGADGVMVTTPFGASVSQHEMIDHFTQIHDAVGLEIFIYNENSLSKNIIESQTLVDISRLTRVVGIKESMDQDLDPLVISALNANAVAVYQGWENRIVNDELTNGNICSLSNLYPDICLQAAHATSDELVPVVDDLCKKHGIYEENWYEHIKAHLLASGVISTDLVLEQQ